MHNRPSRPRLLCLLLLSLVAALAVACGSSESVTGENPGVSTDAISVCSQFAATPVQSGEYTVQTDEWNSTLPQCLTVGGPAFSVFTANFNLPTNGPPASYPSIYKGCHWGSCTSSATSGLPIQVAALPPVTSSWSTVQTSTGAYDVAYDIWFNQSPTTSGQPNGTELMIWLASAGGVTPAGSIVATVSIAGATWNVWEAPMAGWTYVAYQRVTPTSAVSNLDLIAFFQDAVSRGFLLPSWYLIDIEAGFEIWRGGAGLATNSFSATIGGGTHCDRFANTAVQGGQYDIQNNDWNSTLQECVETNGASFAVTQGAFNLSTGGPPAAYPSIYSGCHWGKCTNGATSGMPVQVEALQAATSSLTTVDGGPGVHATAYDIWFNQTPATSGQPDGAELMIWLSSQGGAHPSGSVVGTASVAGATWNVWQASRYIAYERQTPVAAVDGLDIGAIIQDAAARGALLPSWYLIDIEAGFEVWTGGQGLAMTAFSALVSP